VSRGDDVAVDLERHREAIRRIAASHGAHRLRIFGSVARGEGRPDSDLDLLLELEPGRDLLDLVAIKLDIRELLGRDVDVVTEASISPYMREGILRDAVPL